MNKELTAEEKLITRFLYWFFETSSKEPTRFETDLEDIAMMFVAENPKALTESNSQYKEEIEIHKGNNTDLFNQLKEAQLEINKLRDQNKRLKEGIEWISVDKEVPHYYKSVVAISSNQSRAIVHRVSDGDNQYYVISGTDETLKNVTHWQPLPNPPKTETK
jgi:hypothetical protein